MFNAVNVMDLQISVINVLGIVLTYQTAIAQQKLYIICQYQLVKLVIIDVKYVLMYFIIVEFVLQIEIKILQCVLVQMEHLMMLIMKMKIV